MEHKSESHQASGENIGEYLHNHRWNKIFFPKESKEALAVKKKKEKKKLLLNWILLKLGIHTSQIHTSHWETVRISLHKREYPTNKHVKIVSPSLVIIKMQVKTPVRHHYYLLEWLEWKGLVILSIGEVVEQLEFSYVASGDIK